MKPSPTRVDLRDASALTFVNGIQATGVIGLLFMYGTFFSMILSTRRAEGCLGVMPALVSPRCFLLVSYWEDERSLQRFIGAKAHVRWMQFLSRHPGSLRLFNETYASPLKVNYIGTPRGYAEVHLRTNPAPRQPAARSSLIAPMPLPHYLSQKPTKAMQSRFG